MTKRPPEEYDEEEAKRRFEAALKGVMNAPPQAAEGKAEGESEEEARQVSRDSG
jgi:hypothetical protein